MISIWWIYCLKFIKQIAAEQYFGASYVGVVKKSSHRLSKCLGNTFFLIEIAITLSQNFSEDKIHL